MYIKLKWLLPLLILLFTVAINAIAYWNSEKMQVDETERELLSETRGQITLLQGIIERFILLNDVVGIRDSVSSFGANVDSELMYVVNADGIIVASTRMAYVGKHWSSLNETVDVDLVANLAITRGTEIFLQSDQHRVVGYSSICNEDVSVSLRPDQCGFIYARMTTVHRIEDAVAALRWQTSLVALGTALMAVMLWYLFEILITKRTYRLAHTMDSFSQGKREARIEMTGRDELARVGASVDAMLDRIVEEESNLRASKDHLQRLFEAVPDAILIVDQDGLIRTINHSAEYILGYEKETLEGQNISDLLSCEAGALMSFQSCINKHQPLAKGELLQAEVAHANGEMLSVEMSLNEMRSDEELLYIVVLHDISARLKAQSQLLLAQKVFESAAEGIVVASVDKRIIDVNPAYEKMMGYSREELIGKDPNIIRSDRHDEIFYAAMWDEIRSTGTWSGEIWDRRKNGEVFPTWLNISVIRDVATEVIQYVGIFSDISKQKSTEAKLQELAYFDPLTSLPNRALFHDRLEREIVVSRRNAGSFVLMFLDLDHFKDVNDSLGHVVGDELLVQVAERLQTCVRESDSVARLGGDEFTVILSEISDATFAAQIADDIIAAIKEPFQIKGYDVYVGASIGMAVYPADGEDSESLIKSADTAMYQAKESGRGNYKFFTPAMNQLNIQRIEMERLIRQGLAQDEFIVYYQPKIDILRNVVVGVEALVRWNHEGQVISPLEFIPLAEDTGLIIPIGRCVLKKVCQQISAWQMAGLSAGSVAVNLSCKQFQQGKLLVDEIDALLNEFEIPSSSLELEITESMIMDNVDEAISIMQKLGDRGIKISIDDFGTGYSSLSYLKKFPIDVLKVDRSFISDVENSPDDASIVASIISMAQSLNLHVVAEGVETDAQLEFLRSHGCDMVQGYLYSRPLPADEYGIWLQAWQAQPADQKNVAITNSL